MATMNHTPRVHIAQTPEEDLYAHCRSSVHGLGRSLEDMDDEALVALLEEPEFMHVMTPLERELWVRLGAQLDMAGGGTYVLEN